MKSNKLVIDSSVFVSCFGKPDEFTKASKKFFKGIPNNVQINLPSIVVAETLTTFSKQGKSIGNIFKKLLSFEITQLDNNFLVKFSKILKPTPLRTLDLIIAATAKFYSALLISWDKRHLSSENFLCQTLTPNQYLKALSKMKPPL